MLVLFLAGGIASGKSTVAKRLAEHGARRIDLDALSHELLAPGSPLIAQIAERFGGDIVDPETGELDRSLLASRAFSSPGSVAILEGIQHPAIFALLEERIAQAAAEAAPPPAIVVEVPLLTKMGDAISLADEVMVVTCSEEVRRAHARARGMQEADYLARRALQPADEELVRLADVVIDNSGTYDDLIGKVDAWWASRVCGEAPQTTG